MQFNAHTSTFTLEHRPKNKNTYIRISKEGQIVVRSPIQNIDRLRVLLHEKEEWINQKLETIVLKDSIHHEYGETILYRGELHSIDQFSFLIKKLKNSLDFKV